MGQRKATPREQELYNIAHVLELQLEGIHRELYVWGTQRAIINRIDLALRIHAESEQILIRLKSIEKELREIAAAEECAITEAGN